MPRPELALQRPGDRADLTHVACPGRYTSSLAGANTRSVPQPAKSVRSASSVARVLGEVLGGAELAGVDVDRDDGVVALRPAGGPG